MLPYFPKSSNWNAALDQTCVQDQGQALITFAVEVTGFALLSPSPKRNSLSDICSDSRILEYHFSALGRNKIG